MYAVLAFHVCTQRQIEHAPLNAHLTVLSPPQSKDADWRIHISVLQLNQSPAMTCESVYGNNKSKDGRSHPRCGKSEPSFNVCVCVCVVRGLAFVPRSTSKERVVLDQEADEDCDRQPSLGEGRLCDVRLSQTQGSRTGGRRLAVRSVSCEPDVFNDRPRATSSIASRFTIAIGKIALIAFQCTIPE